MIKELRLGNWVFSKQHNVACTVSILATETIDVAISGVPTSHDINDYDPIPLTPEILGNIKYMVKTRKERPLKYFLPIPEIKCEIHIERYLGSWVIELNNHIIPIVTDCKPYLHQLQNLFFALTGKELDVKI